MDISTNKFYDALSFIKKIPKRRFNNWIKALESGEYSQARQVLTNSQGFCCLGVYCEVNRGYEFDQYGVVHCSEGESEDHIPNFGYDGQNVFICFNDKDGLNFKEIASIAKALRKSRSDNHAIKLLKDIGVKVTDD